MRLFSVVIIVTCSMLTACSMGRSSFSHLDLKEELKTSVLENGIKQFHYTIQMPERFKTKPRQTRHKNPQSKEEYQMAFKRYAQEKLSEALVARNYCSDDFLIYDQLIRRDELVIRGECKY